MRGALWLLAGLAAWGATPSGASGSRELTVDEVVSRVQSHYDQIRDFEADFRQRYERRVLGKTLEESGQVWVKKPGRMRWEYRQPEEKLFVTDGSKSYFYLPEENQVMVSRAPQGAMSFSSSSPFALLAGRSRLEETFVAMPSDAPPQLGGVMLELLPREPQQEFERVELEIDPSTGRVVRVVLLDGQGNRTDFQFDNVRENRGLPESLFQFQIPPGVEVLASSESPAESRP